MNILLGPVLNFRGVFGDRARYNILIVADALAAPLQLIIGDISFEPEVLLEQYGKKVFSYLVNLPLTDTEQIISYDLAGTINQFYVPPKDGMPKIAYCSCNGFSSPAEIGKVEFKENMWRNQDSKKYSHSGLLDKHTQEKYNLLIMGGDQIYADSIWYDVKELNPWKDLDFNERVNFPVTQNLKEKIDEFYFDLYVSRWGQGEFKTALATIPTMMMWDDHDIFDGWGSYHSTLQASPLFQTIFESAKKYFSIFQMQSAPSVKPEICFSPADFSSFTRLNKLAILTLDLRSHRTIDQIIHPDTFRSLKAVIGSLDEGECLHLFVMCSIPIAHPDMSWIDSIAEAVLPHEYETFDLMDDLRDHWNSVNHKTERLRLIHNLFSFSQQKKMRVTVLSGDVHVGATGVIKNDREPNSPKNSDRINQITSSGIVHPGPPKIMKYFYDVLSLKTQEIDREITVQMLPFPGTSQKFILKRNWVSLMPDSSNNYWMNLYSEESRQVFEKAIHPVG